MEKIQICLLGDIMLGRYTFSDKLSNLNTFSDKLNNLLKNNFSIDSLKQIYGTTLPILKNCDLVCANLETAITNEQIKIPKVFNYKIDPIFINSLIFNKNIFFNLANNHILDYNQNGMFETMKILNENGFNFGGFGKNLAFAMKLKS